MSQKNKTSCTFQDTVTALQALSAYSIATENRVTSLTVTMENLKDNKEKTITITDEDKNREYVEELVSRLFTIYIVKV